jgi:hypothetical protein
MSLSIRLFGPFRVIVDGTPIDETRWGRRKAETLIKLLALQPQRQMHREQPRDAQSPQQSRSSNRRRGGSSAPRLDRRLLMHSGSAGRHRRRLRNRKAAATLRCRDQPPILSSLLHFPRFAVKPLRNEGLSFIGMMTSSRGPLRNRCKNSLQCIDSAEHSTATESQFDPMRKSDVQELVSLDKKCQGRLRTMDSREDAYRR